MLTLIGKRQLQTLSYGENVVLLIVGLAVVTMGALATQSGWQVTIIPLLILTGLIVLFHPLTGVYLLLVAMQFKTSLPGTNGVYPADAVSFLVIFACVVNLALRGLPPLAHTRFNLIVFLILTIFGLSLAVAYNPIIGLVNLGRHAQLFSLMLIVATYVKPDSVDGVYTWLLILVCITSVFNIAIAAAGGGSERVFGPAGPFFAVFAVVSFINAAIHFIMVEGLRKRLLWGFTLFLVGGGLVFTQTRAAWIQLLLSLIFLFGALLWWSSRTGQSTIRRRLVITAVVLAVVALIVVTGAFSIFQRSAARVSEVVEGHASTVGYRLFLWKLGLKAFAEHPITGIGLAQVTEWDKFMPSWRFYFNAVTVHGLGAHNDFITYLAETGIPGTVLILTFFWMLFKRGARRFRECKTVQQAIRNLIVWIPATALMIGYFFSTHIFYSNSGLLTALCFGLLMSYSAEDERRVGHVEIQSQF